MKKLLLALLITVLAFITACAASKDATDSTAFAVEGEKVYSPTFTGCFILYLLAPERLAGWSGRLMDHEKEYISQEYQDIPVIGGWWESQPIDKELVIKHKIKKAFVIGDPEKPDDRVEDLKKLGMDVLIIKADRIEEYIPLLRELGRQMGIPERGEELAAFGEEMLTRTRDMVMDIPEDEKASVYAGHGPVGLNGMCALDALDIAGGKNAIQCQAGSHRQFSFEQVMTLDPDTIIITNPAGRVVMDDPKWHRLRAYKEGRIYVVPFGPFGWMHMPEITRFMGTPWLACKLYPGRCAIDIEAETRRFYELFMHTNLSNSQLNEILYRYGK